jgi:hypothetical protein
MITGDRLLFIAVREKRILFEGGGSKFSLAFLNFATLSD